MKRAIRIAPGDNVATAVDALREGEPLRVSGAGEEITLVVAEAISAGHKVALRDMAAGDKVIKAGEVIGRTTAPVCRGAWVHLHNMEALRARGERV